MSILLSVITSPLLGRLRLRYADDIKIDIKEVASIKDELTISPSIAYDEVCFIWIISLDGNSSA